FAGTCARQAARRRTRRGARNGGRAATCGRPKHCARSAPPPRTASDGHRAERRCDSGRACADYTTTRTPADSAMLTRSFLVRRVAHRSLPVAAVAAGLLASGRVLPAQTRPAQHLPSFEQMYGFKPGTDRKLPSWKQVTDYFTALAKASPRVQLRTLGKTVLGRPFLVAFISDSANLAHLERYRTIQRKLMDPRLRTPRDSREQLIEQGKNVIRVTCSIHSTEVGGWSTGLVLADRLARGNDAETRMILQNTIILLVPSQNPDGVDIVGDWYRSTLDTPAEGTSPPELYHHYTGHDNNRDWYAFTQPETRYVVDSLYTPWDPQIVNDIHQQGGNAGRIFIPPYMDPVEPNIDPILTSSTNAL